MIRSTLWTILLAAAVLASDRPTYASRWAILIGVDRYTQSDVFRPLRYAGRDVNHLTEVLVASGYERSHVLTMNSDAAESALQPSRAAIIEQFRSLLARHSLSNADSLLVVFAGHGINVQGTSFLCPSDAEIRQPAATMLSLSDLSTVLASSAAGQKFLVIDACREEVESKSDNDFNLLTGLRKLSVGSAEAQGIVYFASCVAGQSSVEDDNLKHGIFLYYFSEAISGLADVQAAGNRDGVVSCHEAFQYAAMKTRKRSQLQTNVEQQPWYEGRGTSGLTLAELSSEQQAKLLAIPPDESDAHIAATMHSHQELTEALMALQSGDLKTVAAKAAAAIELDPGNRMAYRTASLAYQIQGDYTQAVSTLQRIGEPLTVRLTSPLSLKQDTTTLARAAAGDVIEIQSIRKQPNGGSWALVTKIRRDGSRTDKDTQTVRGFVRLESSDEDPNLLSLAAATPVDQVREFNRSNYQPSYIADSWQAGGNAVTLLERYNDVRDVVNRIPYAPSLPGIPYADSILSRLGR